MNIGEIISAFDVLQQQVTSPVQQLRKEIDLMRSELSWYEKKYPESDTTKRRERLMRLEVICKSLESCEPISLMPLARSTFVCHLDITPRQNLEISVRRTILQFLLEATSCGFLEI